MRSRRVFKTFKVVVCVVGWALICVILDMDATMMEVGGRVLPQPIPALVTRSHVSSFVRR